MFWKIDKTQFLKDNLYFIEVKVISRFDGDPEKSRRVLKFHITAFLKLPKNTPSTVAFGISGLRSFVCSPRKVSNNLEICKASIYQGF